MSLSETDPTRRGFLKNSGAGAAMAALGCSTIPCAIASAVHRVERPPGGFRGLFFNPNIPHQGMAGYPLPVFDPYGPEYRGKIRLALRELATEARINLICVFIPIPFTLAVPAQAPRAGQPIQEWANLTYLKNVAVFVDDCHDAGVSVELDLVDNRWIPFRVDPQRHIGRPGKFGWPVADDTPWDEAATWYHEVIEFIESNAMYPDNIAMWSMMGHYQHGTAEPELWGNDFNPAIPTFTERFVKHVWPVFRSAGKRPKAAPYVMPIFSNVSYWMTKTPQQRLSGVSNLRKWLVDDLALPPDYWPMTTYPFCDPAPDGFFYLRSIVKILGHEHAPRILSTDFKGPGHEHELKECIISTEGHPGPDILQWHFQKCAEYGFAGWWMWAYQDQEVPENHQGIRRANGQWKRELLLTIKKQSS